MKGNNTSNVAIDSPSAKVRKMIQKEVTRIMIQDMPFKMAWSRAKSFSNNNSETSMTRFCEKHEIHIHKDEVSGFREILTADLITAMVIDVFGAGSTQFVDDYLPKNSNQ